MLQSPTKRVQRQQRLNTACENPLLEAKQAQNALTSLPAHKRSYQRQQHRRQLSVPDESLLLTSGVSSKVMSFDIGERGAVNMNGNNMMNPTFSVFTVTEQQSLSNHPRQGPISFFFFFCISYFLFREHAWYIKRWGTD